MKLLRVEPDRVLIRFGPFVRATIPRDRITDVRVARPSFWAGIGGHWWRGAWVVNTRFGDAVELSLSAPVRVWVLGFPARGRRFQVVVKDPAAYVAELTA